MTTKTAALPAFGKTAVVPAGRVGERAYPRLIRALLIAVFVVVTVRLAATPLLIGLPFGWDAVVYTEAARAWLAGGNPWLAVSHNIPYAAPPPSFLAYVPFVWLPDVGVSLAWLGITTGSAVYSLRKLRMPMWWLLFPPVSLGIMAGSSALPVTALLIRGGVIADGFSVLTRVYAAIPLLVLAKWRSLAVTAVMFALTLPIWPLWFAERERWSGHLAGAASDLSAMSALWLVPLAVAGLALLGRKRAAWLVVPALWPDTQLYYGVIALPVLAELPLVALAMAIPAPGLIVAGMAAEAVRERRVSAKIPRPFKWSTKQPV